MSSIAEKLNYLNETKKAIKEALIEKGVSVADTDPFRNYANKIKEISGGGSAPETNGKYSVKVIDYDGTVLKEAKLDAGATFELPTAPTHERLVFQEWSGTVDIVDNIVTVTDNNIIIGAIYTTESGQNEFDIELTKATGLEVMLNMDGTKDWGDGTSDDLTTHTYSSYGEYTIKCSGSKMTSSSSNGLFLSNYNSKNYYLKNVRLGNINTITSYCFSYCISLTTITIPTNVTKLEPYIFDNCSSLKCIIFSNHITLFNAGLFCYCYLLKYVKLPKNITGKLSSNTFSENRLLTNLIFPNGITELSGSLISYNLVMKNIKIPNNIIKLGSQTFYRCYCIFLYDFSSHTIVPTLSSSNVFDGINQLCKIYVPDNLYDEWIAATNWATYANYIYKASEMED